MQVTRLPFILFTVDDRSGLWDVMTSDAAVEFVHARLVGGEGGMSGCSCSPHAIATELAEEALARGSTDNVTVCIVTLPRVGGEGVS